MIASKDKIKVTSSLAPIAVSAARTGTGIDLANVIENTVVLQPGLWTDGTHTPKLQESADNTTYTDVSASDLVGAFVPISNTTTAVVQKVSYIGKQRYIRPVLTPTGMTVGVIAGVVVITKTRKQP